MYIEIRLARASGCCRRGAAGTGTRTGCFRAAWRRIRRRRGSSQARPGSRAGWWPGSGAPSAASQRPSARAASTSARPAGASAGRDQRFGLLAVDLRPPAARAARREPLQEVLVVEARASPSIQPKQIACSSASAWLSVSRGRALLGDLQPGAARGVVVVVCLQPALPGRLVSELDDREVVLWHLASQRTQRAGPGVGRLRLVTEHPL